MSAIPAPVVAERLASQLLGDAAVADPVEAVRALLAVQAQDGRGFRLALRARVSSSLTAADVEALLASRTVVVSWLCRGTLHLVCAEDYWWLHALCTPGLLTGCLRRLEQKGVSAPAADAAVKKIDVALRSSGPLVRSEIATLVELPAVGRSLIHVLFLASLRGVLVRGPMVGKHHAYVSAAEWLGAPPPFDRSAALTELAVRYLRAHSPATDRDLARWAGVPLRDARAGLAAAGYSGGGLLRGRDALGGPDAGPVGPATPEPVLLGAWDPLLVGWTDRSWVTGPFDSRVVSGGLFRPFGLVGGAAVCTWGVRAGRVQLDEPLVPVGAAPQRALDTDAQAVASFLGLKT